MNLKKECLGRGNAFTLKLTFCLCLLDKQQSNQTCWVFYPEAFTLLKRQMSDWCDCGSDVKVAHIQRQRLRMQRYPNQLWIWSRMVRVLWPLTSCLELHMCARVPYGGLLKWWAWMWLLMASKSFLDFFQPESFSLQTGIQAAAISTCYQLPHSNQGFPRVQREDDSDSPNSSWRPQQLWNIPDLLLKVYDFWPHFEGRIANCIKTFSVRTFETCPMVFVLFNPSLGWEWVKFNRVLISSREKLTLSLRLPLVPIGMTLSILSDPGIIPLLSTQKYQEHVWGSCNVLAEICAP